MADQILEKLREAAEGQIDFEGQRFAEFLATAMLAIVGAIAFVVGYLHQDIKQALFIGLGGTLLTFVLIVPPWPIFNRHPVKWLPVKGQNSSAQSIMVDGEVVG